MDDVVDGANADNGGITTEGEHHGWPRPEGFEALPDGSFVMVAQSWQHDWMGLSKGFWFRSVGQEL